MLNTDPDVSVVIAAWNAARTVGDAMDAALAQDGIAVQVIAVDDASTDDTLAIMRRRAQSDPRLTILAHDTNKGPAAARNLALSRASAPYVTVLDADDTMGPDRLAQLKSIADAGAWDFVADDLYKVPHDDPGAPPERLWSDEDIGLRAIDFAAFVRGNLSRLHGGRGEMGFLKPLMRRSMLERHDLRYDETLRLGEDYVFYATALARGARFCLTDPKGYFALVRPDSLSGHHSAADLRALVMADRVIAREPGLSPADRRILSAHEIETRKRWSWLRLIAAVKARDPIEAGRCFVARPTVAASLCARLGEQAVLRLTASMRRAFGAAGP